MLLPLSARARSAMAIVTVALVSGPPIPQAPPTTTIHVRALDFAFEMPDSLRAGTHVWTFENAGVKGVVDSLHARGLRAFFSKESMAIAGNALFAPPGLTANAELVTHDSSRRHPPRVLSAP